MKSPIIYLFLLGCLLTFARCTNVEKYNRFIETPLSVKAMQQDIDYVERNLLKMHPSLFLYVSEDQLRFKFDSLRSAIKQPLLPNEFQLALAPVLAEVKQGHMTLNPLIAKPDIKGKKDKERYQKSKGPFSQLGFHWQDGNLYLSKNSTANSSLVLGSQIATIEGISPASLFKKYRKTFTSDGFNTTFIDKAFERLLPRYYQLELGYRDSIHVIFSCADSTYQRTVLRRYEEPKRKPSGADSLKNKQGSHSKQAQVPSVDKKRRRIFGYNSSTKEISKSLSFPVSGDSSIAFLRVKDFTYGKAKSAYKLIFDTLYNCGTEHLILDLRSNFGGRLSDVNELYSYLVTAEKYQFIQPAIINSRSKLPFYAIKGLPVWSYPILSPFILSSTVVLWTKTFSKDGVRYIHLPGSKVKKSKSNSYEGDLFVLIDGGTFSAASLIAADLKESKRATVIGEESGGAANGTVAGFLPKLTLPHSHLSWRLGLMEVKPYYPVQQVGHGVVPDILLPLQADDVINKTDPALDWILKSLNK